MRFILEASYDRPVVELDDIYRGCSALIDTGALIPIWTKSELLFLEIFRDAELIELNRKFKGFGNGAYGNLYKINFKLGEFLYPKMPVIVCEDEQILGMFLFSATMFSKMNYTIMNSTKELIIDPIDNQKCFNIVIGDNVLMQFG